MAPGSAPTTAAPARRAVQEQCKWHHDSKHRHRRHRLVSFCFRLDGLRAEQCRESRQRQQMAHILAHMGGPRHVDRPWLQAATPDPTRHEKL